MKPGESMAGDAREETGRDVGWGEERWAPPQLQRWRGDARPAPPGQAVIVHAGQPASEKGHREQVHTNDDVTCRVRPGMATPARQGDDHKRPTSRDG
ncbi:MAG: hypothetical protein JWN52_1981 [Actinomycetia bacterium]|nr:hypothetical protein [Actinomycetes bacterium]